MLTEDERQADLGDVLTAHNVVRLGPLGPVKCRACDHWTEGTIADHHAALAQEYVSVKTLGAAIDFAHEEQRRGVSMGRSEEQMTLFQHWSATAGWLASRVRAIQRGDEPDWPDAMNTAPTHDRAVEREEETHG